MNLIVKQWIEALESGEYKFGQDRLKLSDNTFCCLGVLCDLYAKSHPDEESWIDVPYDGIHFQEMKFSMPIKVINWAQCYFLDQDELVVINDRTSTVDYSKQIEYIRDHYSNF